MLAKYIYEKPGPSLLYLYAFSNLSSSLFKIVTGLIFKNLVFDMDFPPKSQRIPYIKSRHDL